MFKMHWSEDGRLHNEIGMTPALQGRGGIKVYILDKQNCNRRKAWFYKLDHQQYNRDPLECYRCRKHVEIGDKVVTKIGRALSHIYHIKCAREMKVI